MRNTAEEPGYRERPRAQTEKTHERMLLAKRTQRNSSSGPAGEVFSEGGRLGLAGERREKKEEEKKKRRKKRECGRKTANETKAEADNDGASLVLRVVWKKRVRKRGREWRRRSLDFSLVWSRSVLGVLFWRE